MEVGIRPCHHLEGPRRAFLECAKSMDAFRDERLAAPQIDDQIEEGGRSDQASSAGSSASKRLDALLSRVGRHSVIVTSLVFTSNSSVAPTSRRALLVSSTLAVDTPPEGLTSTLTRT